MRFRLPFLLAVFALWSSAGTSLLAAAADPGYHGLPWTRLYPFEQIGNAPRRVRLSFDPYGRLAAVYDQLFTVLNDSAWLDLVRVSPIVGKNMGIALRAADGRTYFCGRASWGLVSITPEGHLDLVNLPRENAPEWTSRSLFAHIVSTEDGVCFWSDEGLILWNAKKRTTQYALIPLLCRVFTVGPRLFVSCFGDKLFELNPANAATTPLNLPLLRGRTFDNATPLGPSTTLLSAMDGTMYSFNGDTAKPWAPQAERNLFGRVTALVTLPDRAVAIALEGKGIFVVTADGEVIASLPTPEFQRVSSLASNEAGVLWATTEDGVEKILYRAQITAFGQRLGLPAAWPAVVHWQGNLIVANVNQLYVSKAGAVGSYTRFEPWKSTSELSAWTIATSGDQLLVGNAKGVYSVSKDGAVSPIIAISGAKHLALISPTRCFVFGDRETALLHFADGRWEEEAPRVPSPGMAAMVHASPYAAWLEFGGNRVARASLEKGRIVTREMHDLPWPSTSWVSVGVVGKIVVLTASGNEHIYFDDEKNAWTTAPDLDRLLKRSPYWITRVFRDADGNIWGTHNRGVVKFIRSGDDYDIDATSLDLVNERFPMIQIVDGNDVWISSGGSLYHAEPGAASAQIQPVKPPVLISLLDGKTGIDLTKHFHAGSAPLQLPYDHRSLTFQFFSGSYQDIKDAPLIYRINGSSDWKSFDPGSLLRLEELRDGKHLIEVRQSDFGGHPSASMSVSFEILPPWQRTWWAYPIYAVAALLAIFSAVKLSRRQMRRRNQELERLIAERTKDLEIAMAKLNEETRNAAIAAERNRLAGEIHDSLQQGLSGVMFQLEATLKMPGMPKEIRSLLTTAREMVSFTRREVQHVVWDLGTPLLNGADLHDGLRKMVTLLASGTVPVELIVIGPAAPLSSACKHHLLRIAQEAINNAIRHAQAQRIQISLIYGEQAITLKIVDDGVGFSVDHAGDLGFAHFGLRGMQERAMKFGGTFSVASTPGGGTVVQVAAALQTEAVV